MPILSSVSVLDKYSNHDPSPCLNRITPVPSQILQVTYRDKLLNITLDSGATVSYIKFDKAVELGIDIFPNSQLALLADKKTRMASIGEVDFIVTI